MNIYILFDCQFSADIPKVYIPIKISIYIKESQKRIMNITVFIFVIL